MSSTLCSNSRASRGPIDHPLESELKRLHLVPLAMLLLLSVPHYAAAGPVYVGSVADPLGDTFGPGPDIVFAGIVVDDSWVAFHDAVCRRDGSGHDQVRVQPGCGPKHPATGDPWNGLGVDFLVIQGRVGNTGTASLITFPGEPSRWAPVTFLGDQVGSSFARSLFGAEDGLLDFIAAVQVALDSQYVRSYP